MGVRRGFPDLVLYLPRHNFTGLVIEMKSSKGGRVSEEQTNWMAWLKECGFDCHVATGLEQSIRVFDEYMAD